jgi:hypothetical protein
MSNAAAAMRVDSRVIIRPNTNNWRHLLKTISIADVTASQGSGDHQHYAFSGSPALAVCRLGRCHGLAIGVAAEQRCYSPVLGCWLLSITKHPHQVAHDVTNMELGFLEYL